MVFRSVYAVIVLLSLLNSNCLLAQDQVALADSTEKIAFSHFKTGDVQTASGLFEQVIALRSNTDSSRLLSVFTNLGRCYAEMGRKEDAWTTYQTTLRLAMKLGKEKGLGYLYNNIGILEEEQGNNEQAAIYFHKGLEVSQRVGNVGSEALCHESLGIFYATQNDYAQSEKHLIRALEIYEKSGEVPLVATVQCNLGALAAKQKKDGEAIEWFEQSIATSRRAGSYSYMLEVAASMAQVYLDSKQTEKALQSLRAMDPVLDSVEQLPPLSNYYQSLGMAYQAAGNWQKAYDATARYHTLRDSLFSQEQKMALDNLKTQYEVAEKDQELTLQKATIARQRQWQWALAIGLVLVGLLALNWWRAFRYKSRVNRIIRVEQKRSDDLLLNILPSSIADELKANNRVEARRFEEVTVICTDFQDFTGIAGRLTPEQLVKLLDEYFRGFDEITTRFGIEKIKTMGDAYMCTGGLPDPAVGTPAETLRTALAMRNLVTEMGERKSAAGEPYFNCRIGLHTGPVVAGIVGQKKFVYDIWGDTVNTATRMEQYGAVGEVNLSSTTQQLLADDEQFQFEYRGEIEVKGKGKIGMYFAR